jgi:hypothetical protein
MEKVDSGRKNFQVEKIISPIPEIELSLRDIYGSQENVGYIPILAGYWGMGDTNLLRKELDENFRQWGPRKVIEKNKPTKANWGSIDYAIIFYINPKTKEIFDEWENNGTLEENIDKVFDWDLPKHYVRLLTHQNASACEDFVIDCLKYVPLLSHKEIMRIFPQTQDGGEVAQCFTFAPYILEALKASGKYSARESFLKVLSWINSRQRLGDGNAIYPGIKEIHDEASNFFLARDGNHSTHKLARIIGEHIAKFL